MRHKSVTFEFEEEIGRRDSRIIEHREETRSMKLLAVCVVGRLPLHLNLALLCGDYIGLIRCHSINQ